jgi:hypothetical protein
LLITATSSIIAAISSNNAKKPDAILIVLETALNYFFERKFVLALCLFIPANLKLFLFTLFIKGMNF